MKVTKAVVRRVGLGLALVVAVNLMVLGLLTRSSLADLQHFSDDQLMRTGADKLDMGTIVIGAIDDASLTAFNARAPYEIDRAQWAELIRRLKDAGTRVVAFDFTLQESGQNDPQLAAAINYAMHPTDGSKPMFVIMASSGQGAPQRVKDKGLVFNSFQPIAPGIAAGKPIVAGIDVDPDGAYVRNLPLLYQDAAGKTQLAPLPLVAATAFAVSIPGFKADYTFENDPYRLDFGPYHIPIDQYLRMPIYYFSRPQGYRNTAYSVAQMASGQIDPARLRNRIVLIGSYGATGLADDYPVPTSVNTKMDSVEIWANVTQSLVEGKFITAQPIPSTFGFMFGMGLVAAIVFLRFGSLGWVATIVLGGGYTAIRYSLTASQMQAAAVIGKEQVVEMPNIAYIDVALLLSSAILFIYLFLDEQRRRSAVYSTFGRYVTPAVAEQLSSMQATGELNLGGTRRMATIFFGNLYPPHGTPAEAMLTLLNRYWDGIVRIVNQNGGTVNKFIGDHIMVMFNVPVDMPDHAAAGARAAYQAVEWIKQERLKYPGQEATFGVGVNSGQLVAGNMGSKNRMEYTVLGDTVNTASRLSGVAKDDEVIISQATLDRMDGSGVKVEDRGEVRVKGKTEPIHVYCVLGFAAEGGPAQVMQPVSIAAG